ncbi:hypothetical protein QYM36_003981 [Artemia franciscana]|uniref:Uncharacterized protein n=1 Tax=Artemia franciscana TaxID=6661 RepID=A0AA88IH86_ARTSF|nr:hypothetical protein QYM36_003981 [Artemia franciscana]
MVLDMLRKDEHKKEKRHELVQGERNYRKVQTELYVQMALVQMVNFVHAVNDNKQHNEVWLEIIPAFSVPYTLLMKNLAERETLGLPKPELRDKVFKYIEHFFCYTVNTFVFAMYLCQFNEKPVMVFAMMAALITCRWIIHVIVYFKELKSRFEDGSFHTKEGIMTIFKGVFKGTWDALPRTHALEKIYTPRYQYLSFHFIRLVPTIVQFGLIATLEGPSKDEFKGFRRDCMNSLIFVCTFLITLLGLCYVIVRSKAEVDEAKLQDFTIKKQKEMKEAARAKASGKLTA